MPPCQQRFSDRLALFQHPRETGHSKVCGACGSFFHFDIDAFWRHVSENNACTTCERHFDTPSNLVHCLGCVRKFSAYGGMIIHLESGACKSQMVESDLSQSAALCFQWKKFSINPVDRQVAIDNESFFEYLREKHGPAVCFYKCPSCDQRFPKLSSLFMHIESPACSQTLGDGAIGKLRAWLINRHVSPIRMRSKKKES
ncbi:hypothetical protein EK21DRAFT_99895 [Setomelanomma holmii]|uniref:C2H2-type domain-containing protein n=1 Tax=Setomelanomma holmii TaxID=210430 RepID=A0A9P4HAV8_9PLEO|nr:hypothetical protein EK21DRAFT_99895 [Setomelanomma holmii]